MAMGLLTEGLVTAVIGRVVDVASTHIEDRFKWREGKEEELQRLNMLLPQIQSVVGAAERGEQPIPDPLWESLWQLKDALYEAGDVLDELDYLQLKQQAEADDANKKEQYKVRELMSHYIKFAKHIFKPDHTPDKLRRAVKKLGELMSHSIKFAKHIFKPDHTPDKLRRAVKKFGELMSHYIKFAKRIFKPDHTPDKLRRAVKKLGELMSQSIKFAKHIFKPDHTPDKLRRAVKKLGELMSQTIKFAKHIFKPDHTPDKLRRAVKKFGELMSHSIKFAKHIFKPDRTLDKLRRAVTKLGEVAADVGKFDQLVSNTQRGFQQQETQTILKRETGPLLTESKVLGREKERDELLRWLMAADHEDESNMNVLLFSVVGHGGMGKTTLAQLVYNDEIVQNSFDPKIWVWVSTSFDVRGLTRFILESATRKRPDVDGLPALQVDLMKKLKNSGKFLLVLDDVWNDDDSSNWDKLLAPLKYGHKGSKILLTARMDRVTDMAVQAMGASTKESLKLDRLHGEDFYSLFDRYAYAGVDYGNYPNLQCIGKQIAKRLGGSLLAAKTVGGLLKYNLDDRYWTKILDSKNISGRVQHGEDNIMSILMLSYHHLPLHLRPCFAYCGMFPKDHRFRKEDLVLMWMAVGLIQQSHQNQGEMVEDIGGDYFDELIRRSFFDYGDDNDYVMHDLLHDLAQSVSHGECSSFVDDDEKGKETIPNTVRHLYIESGNLDLLTKMDSLHNLCSLVLIIKDARPEHFAALEKLFKSLKSMRLLHVDFGDREITMPDAFSHLIHLRSLKIDGYLQQFPRSLCKLYHLQVIKFSNRKGTIKLPESMNKLVNLRHLSASVQVAEVGKLIFLQELDFSVKKERGYKIGELADLIWLRTLDVGGLENVENQEEASMTKLCNKKYL